MSRRKSREIPPVMMDSFANSNNFRRIVHVDNDRYSLTEILGSSSSCTNDDDDDGQYVDAFCIQVVDPRQCSRILKELSNSHPLTNYGLSHLKRVRQQRLQQHRQLEKQQQQHIGPSPSTKEETSSSPTETAAETTTTITTTSAAANPDTNEEPNPNKRAKVLHEGQSEKMASKKKKKSSNNEVVLEVLICLVASSTNGGDMGKNGTLSTISSKYGPLHVVRVPSRPPESEVEFRRFNSVWPTQYLPLKTQEYKLKQLLHLSSSLSDNNNQQHQQLNEISSMHHFIEQSIKTQAVIIVDPHQWSARGGSDNDDSDSDHPEISDHGRCTVANASSSATSTKVAQMFSSSSSTSSSSKSAIRGKIVSDSRREQYIQNQERRQRYLLKEEYSNMSGQRYNNNNNPLATPILYAIQGVSRSERDRYAMTGFVKSEEQVPVSSCCQQPLVAPPQSSPPMSQQLPLPAPVRYICTGYDIYTYYEPSVFEAMACLHSRVRRLIYFNSFDGDDNSLLTPSDQTTDIAVDVGGCDQETISDCNDEEQNHDDNVISVIGEDHHHRYTMIHHDHHRRPWRNGCSKHSIHDLPGTNHRYRVFEYRRVNQNSHGLKDR